MKQSSIKETSVNCNNMLHPDQNKISTSIMDIGSISVFGFMKFTTYAAISHFSTVRSRFLVDFLCLYLFPSIKHCKICVIGDLNQPTILALDGIRLSINSLEMKDHLVRWWIMTALIIPDCFFTIQIMKGHFVSFRNQSITAFFLWPALHLPSWEDFFGGNYLEDLVSG